MCFRSIYRSAFVQSHSQSQARLMFVTAHENGQLGLHQNQCTLKKFTACLQEGLIHEWIHTLLAPPLSLMQVNNSQHCSMQPPLTSLVYRIAAPMVNCVFQLKPRPALEYTHSYITRQFIVQSPGFIATYPEYLARQLATQLPEVTG